MWARDLYEAYPEIQGILYAATMHGGREVLALNEQFRAEGIHPCMPTSY
jgi:hypothetical protein